MEGEERYCLRCQDCYDRREQEEREEEEKKKKEMTSKVQTNTSLRDRMLKRRKKNK